MVVEMLEAKRMAKSKLDLYLEDASLYILHVKNFQLRAAHRMRLVWLQRSLGSIHDPEQRREAAAKLCRAKGLVVHDASDRNELGESKVLEAAAEGWKGADLHLLVLAGADVKDHDEKGCTVVMLAAMNGHTDTVRGLHALGADVCAANNAGMTAVMLAAMRGHTETLRALHLLGADMWAKDEDGKTAAMHAAEKGQAEAAAFVGGLVEDAGGA